MFSFKNLPSVSNPPKTDDIPSTLPTLLNRSNRLRVILKGNYMKQNKLGYYHRSVINIYILYKLDDLNNAQNIKIKNNDNSSQNFTAQNCLFGAVKITPDADKSSYKYSGFGICFDANSDFSFGNITNGKNVIIFGADMSFSSHERNKANQIYILGRGEIQGVTTVGQTAATKNPTEKGITTYKEGILQTLQRQMKSLYYHYTTMVMILVYLLMGVKN